MSSLKTTPKVTLPCIEARIQQVNKSLASAGLAPVTTADQDAGTLANSIAQASLRYNEWKAGVYKLDAECPGDWDDHAQKLQQLPGIDRPYQVILFTEMKRIANSYGVGYDSLKRRFFLLEVPTFDSIKF